MNFVQALKRVCDDAERWNANKMADQEGYEAIKRVRVFIVWFSEVIINVL